MRKCQITINLQMVGDQAQNGSSEGIVVYADADTVFEAICTGYYELFNALHEQGRELPGFGRREHRIISDISMDGSTP